jgi:AcrR family transcriptional regulator
MMALLFIGLVVCYDPTVTDHRSLHKAPPVCKVGRVTTFQRARSDEQREQRRRAILATAAEMLGEMPVAELSLNELSRRVGLAKSNVLRYFETREAVLLELYDATWTAWLDRLDALLPDADADADAEGTEPPVAEGGLRARYERVAAALTDSLVADPLVCELVSVSASVLERNISPAVARRYKLSAMANTDRMAAQLRRSLPELSPDGAWRAAAGTLLSIGGVWPLTNPSDAMLCVYEDPELARYRLDFPTALAEILSVILAGCLARWPA